MAFDISSLTGYVDQNSKAIIAKAIAAGKTMSVVGQQPGVKGSSAIHLLNAPATLQAGGCGWNASGSTTFTNRAIATSLIKVNEELCDKTLADAYLQWGIATAAGTKSLPFEQEIMDQKIKSIQLKNDLLFWGGDKDASSAASGLSLAETKLMDGMIKILAGVSGSTVSGAVSGKDPLVVADVEAIITNVFAKVPNAVISDPDLKIYVGEDVFRTYVLALQAANRYFYQPDFNANFEMKLPGTQITIVGVPGLNGTKKIYCTPKWNFVAGYDMVSDSEVVKFWYSEDDRVFKFCVEYNLGVQVAYPEYVVVA